MRMRQVEPRLPLVALTEPGFLQVGQPGASVWLGGLDIDDFGGSPVLAARSFGAAALSPVHGNPQGGTVNDPGYVPFTTRAMVEEAHAVGMKVVPWTIDDPATMRKLIDDGVDGIITDYPDRLREVLAERGMPMPRSYDRPAPALRVATFNASLNRPTEGELVQDLSTGDDAQARAVAEIIQRARPDVLLVNEFDFDAAGAAARLFQRNYLSVPQHGAAPIHYDHRFVAPSNTGIPSGFDLDNNGTVGGGNDALGFGDFPGQFGMVVYSRYPILGSGVRTFQRFLWKDMPGGRGCRTTRPRPPRPTGTRRASSACCACPPRATGTCPSWSAARWSTCWPATRRRRCSTAPRTATAPAASTRSACGPTT
jgi:hypothetical protein